LLLAGASFVFFQWLAQPVAPLKDPGKMGVFAVQNLYRAIGLIGQFVVPVGFLGLGILSAIQAALRRGPQVGRVDPHLSEALPREYASPTVPEQDLYAIWREANTEVPQPNPVATNKWSLDLLQLLEWKRFEEICAAYFEALGFRSRMGRAGPDGGVDIHLFQGDDAAACIIVQCKARRKVGVDKVRELFGVMAADGVAEGIFATTGVFTPDARAFADGKNLHLIDGADYLTKIAALPDDKQEALLRRATAGDFTTPTCASCGVKMVARTSGSDGKRFWGCPNFPRCRATMNPRAETAT